MTREEALKELDQHGRAVKAGPVSQREILCAEMREPARILSVAFERVRKRDPLYGYIRSTGVLSTAARACAARLMAPRAVLAIPRLSRRSLDPFCPDGDRKGLLLARSLLQAGIGDAQDWQDSYRRRGTTSAGPLLSQRCITGPILRAPVPKSRRVKISEEGWTMQRSPPT